MTAIFLPPWRECPTLTLDGRLPPRKRFAGNSEDHLQSANALLGAIRREFPPIVRRLALLVRLRTLNRFQSEVRALAKLVDADWRDVLMANLSYDLVISAFGCSTVVLPTPSGPVLARNMDWWPEDLLARASVLVRTEWNGALQFANAGWPGSVGVVSGLSHRGFAFVLNAVTGAENHNRLGYPVLLHLRRVLEDARGFDDALRRLTHPLLMSSCLVTLVGTQNNERVVIERSPTRFALRWPDGDAPLVCTNDYRLLFPQAAFKDDALYRTTCSRFDALCRFFAKHSPDRDVSDKELLYALTDPGVIQGITAQHVIFRPREQSARLLVPRALCGTVPHS